jgi:D-alanine-D-alanine ligase
MVARAPLGSAAVSKRVGVLFGGPSVEHDVSIITALQLMAVLAERHEVIPLYLAADGRLWTGEPLRDVAAFASQPPSGGRPIELRIGGATPFVEPASGRFSKPTDVHIDVVINAIHGTGGEDGTLLGALELAQVPYVGRGVAAAAVGMDKHLAKLVAKAAGLDVLDHERIERAQWEADPDAGVRRARERFPGEAVVKPVTLGSSIGVARCTGEEELREALELAFELDRQAIVEPFATGAVELNVAVLGRPGEIVAVSEVERPIGSESGLSFEDKYMSGGGKGAKGGTADKTGGMAAQDRVIPADVDPAWREAVKQRAVEAHHALRLAGVTRFDFFVLDDGARFVLNEPNTVPGSFAFYLFEPVGLPFHELAERLIEIAVAESREERSTTRTFESALLSLHLDRR